MIVVEHMYDAEAILSTHPLTCLQHAAGAMMLVTCILLLLRPVSQTQSPVQFSS